MVEHQTAADVISSLGGLNAVKALTKAKNTKAVWNWKKANRFPAKTYLALISALAHRGDTAPNTLWNMVK
jgi:hypothetical protein